MNPKRPPSISRPPVTQREWSPDETQSLRSAVDLASETSWRRGTADQIEKMATVLAEVRDLARQTDTSLGFKAAGSELALANTEIAVLKSRIAFLERILFYLAPFVLIGAGILEHKGVL